MEGDGLLIFLTRFNSQFIKVSNSLGERALMFLPGVASFMSGMGRVWEGGGLGRNWSWLFTRRGDTRGERDTERRILGAALQLYDADGLCDHCWGWGRLTYDIGHTLIYNLTEWHKRQENGKWNTKTYLVSLGECTFGENNDKIWPLMNDWYVVGIHCPQSTIWWPSLVPIVYSQMARV